MAKKAHKLKISPARAQDWISSVLNPIMVGLRRELSLLREPVRWLYQTRDFESLHPIEKYVAEIYRDNFDDFIAKYPTLKPDFRRHDDELAKLRRAIAEGYDLLVTDRSFTAAFERETSQHRLTELGRRHFLAHIAAGYLELPEYYEDRELYSRLSRDVRDPDLLAEFKARRVAAVKALEAIDGELYDRLVQLRMTLADQYGARIQPVE